MKIFLSHSSREKPLVREIVGQLPAYIKRWLDEEQLLFGMEIEQSLKSAIQEESDFVIIFLSAQAIASRWVQRELTWALGREKKYGRPFVLPVLLEDVWDHVKPVAFRNRKYLKSFDLSRRGVESLAAQLQDELSGWLAQHFDKRVVEAQKMPAAVDVAGCWRTVFTWEPHYEADPGESTDMIQVTQTTGTFSGLATEGDYKYTFEGKIMGDYLLGEWESQKLPLFGVFQLRLDIDTGDAAEGYWVGNGARAPYHGKWRWERVRPVRRARRKRSKAHT